VGRALLYGLPPAALWAAVFGKLPALRRSPRDPRIRAYWLGLLALALSVTLLRPPWRSSISSDSAIAVREFHRLIGHSLVLVCLWGVEAFSAYSVYPEAQARAHVQRRLWLLAGTVAVMIAAFLAGKGVEVGDRPGALSPFLFYWLPFHTYLGLALVNMIRLNWQWARQTDRAVLGLGLRLTTVGAVFGLAEVAYSLPYLVATQLGWPPRQLLGNQLLITQLLLAATVLPVVVGTTMPAWGPRVGLPRLLVWVGRYRAYLGLYPLWRALCQAVPDVALQAPTSAVADAWTGRRQLGFRLQRRCTEIRDAQLALRPWIDPQATEAAVRLGRQAGLAGEDLQAVVEAASLAAAIQAKTGRWPPTKGPTSAPWGQGGGDLDTESAWLGRVAVAYRRSLIVRAVLTDQQAQQQAVHHPHG
jgi:hypothetical protein